MKSKDTLKTTEKMGELLNLLMFRANGALVLSSRANAPRATFTGNKNDKVVRLGPYQLPSKHSSQ